MAFNNVGQIALSNHVAVQRPNTFFGGIPGVWAGFPYNLELVALETSTQTPAAPGAVFAQPLLGEVNPFVAGDDDLGDVLGCGLAATLQY